MTDRGGISTFSPESSPDTDVRCSIIVPAGDDLSMLNNYLLFLNQAHLSCGYEIVIANDHGLHIDEKLLGRCSLTVRILNIDTQLSQEQLFNKGAIAARGKVLLFVRKFIGFDKLVLEEAIRDLDASKDKISVSANGNFVLAESHFYISNGSIMQIIGKTDEYTPVDTNIGDRPAVQWTPQDQRMLDFYSQFIFPGDVCFDVGANIGNRTKIFLKLGAKVVAVEPQDDCVRCLKVSYGGDDNLRIIRKVLGEKQGQAELMVCNANTISSMSREWIDAVGKSGRFRDYSWDKIQTVSMTTLDKLIEEYGIPAFTKIDVEGFEYEVLKGLSQPLKALSLEFTPEFISSTFQCIEHLQSLGRIQLNYSLGERMQLVLNKWINPKEMIETLKNSGYDNKSFGDVYVKFLTTAEKLSWDGAVSALPGPKHTWPEEGSSCLPKVNLDGGGERVDMFYGKNLVFDLLDMYQKSHYRRYEYAKSVISPGKIIGDFACGTGYGSVMLSENARLVIGVDIDENVIRQIRRRYAGIKNAEFVCANLLDITYQSFFDCIISFETIEHLRETDIPKLFAVFARALKPGGILIFSTPYKQAKSPNAVSMGFHQTFDIDEGKIGRWLSENSIVPECFRYQNYQTHDIEDNLSRKDFIVCLARTCKDSVLKKHVPKVSILIPTFNRAGYLKMAIDSALAQTCPGTEILVLDDCSTDETVNLSHAYSNAANVKFIRNENNIGFINNWNKAVALSSGEYIKIIGDDDILSADCVAEQARILDEHPDVGVVCCNCSIIDESNRVKNNNNPYKLFSRDTEEDGREFIKNYLLGKRAVGWPGAILFRRQDINKAGGFDPQAGCPADIDMWCRILQVKDFYYLDKMLAYCRLFPGNLSGKLQANDFGYKDILCFYFKTVPCVEHILDEPTKRQIWSILITKILPFYSKAQAQNKTTIERDIDSIAERCSSGQTHSPGRLNKNITALIFSKDRAMQLQATIESLLLHCRDNNAANLVVLFKASNPVHKQQYDELKKKFPVVDFVEETDFRKQVLSLIENCKYVLLLVDDNIFVKSFSLRDVIAAIDSEKNAIGFSLRLGKNTEYCYSLSSPQKLPEFERLKEGILKYNWPGAECDFGYPLEVSSSVYRSNEILHLLNKSEFSNPNTLENVMHQNRNTFVSTVPFLLTFEESVTFCNPVNVVQSEYKLNKFGTIHSYTSGQLADCLSRGTAIDVRKYVGFTPDSAHQEVELYFTPAERAIPGTQMTRVSCELKPKFSIVMASYNNGRFIAQAIDSVLSQTLKDWELIIVDDCSTDDSIDVIKRYLTDDRIRLIRRDANKGYVAALKTAIADVRSDTFGVLDSDDCLAAHAVETMYRHHIHSPDCGFIYSQFIHCDENLRSKQLGFCRAIPAGKTTLDMQAVSHFKTFKLRDYLKTSGFDESMQNAEDKDIIYKMEEVTQLKFVDDCLYLYRDLPHSLSHDARKAAIGLESVKRAKSAALQRREQTHKATASLTSIGQLGSRPKVAFVSTTDKRGGAAKVAWMLKKGLAANGFQTKMFVRDKFSDDADVLKISSSGLDRAKELERQGLLYYDIKSTLLLAHNRDFTGCDVFHFHNLHGGYFNPFALAGLSRLKPSVWTLHDMQAITGHCAHSFDCNKWQTGCGNCPNLKTYPAINIDQTARMLEDKRRIYAESNVEIIVPSQWLKDIVAKSILKDKKVHLIYNGIDERIYRPYDKSAVRRQLKLPEDAIVIGFASPKGLVEQFKGGDYILEAYNYFVSKYPNLYFLCVGGKAENAPTERFMQIPFVTDETALAQIYCAADIFMYPSVADNCPLIVLELMGCGVPVVSFEVGGVPELIEHGKTGFLAPYKNIGELIHLTEQLVLDEAGRRRFGQAAIERLCERFTLDRMIDNHIRLYESLTQKRLSGQSEQGGEKPVVSTGQTSKQNRYLVSAIVSTYNSEKFIRGCLEDLENQTIADKLEIIVVNSGSEQNEELVVKEFQKRYSNIVYVKTDGREGLYSAWNRAVNIASGQFLTSANTDDRHRKDALEVMADTLLANTDIALVYGDQIVTDTPNPTFENHRVIELAKRPEFSKERLLFGCCVGSQPMWRKSLHDELGGFDETLTCAADWDFWLKVAGRYSFKYIPEFLGLYYHNKDGIEHGRRIHSLYERYAVGRRYTKQYMSSIPLYEARGNPLVSIVMAAYNAAGYIARAIESVLIQNYRNFELIVVDDGSTDRTAEIVRGFKNEPIKYFYKENGGVSSARNYALKKAGGLFVVILDSDDMMTLDFVARHLRVFEQNPETDLVYCDDCFIDENDKPIRVMSRPEYSDHKALVSALFRYGWAILPFRTCIRKSVFDKIGLYDERLIMSEDYDMVRRFVSQGLRMRHLPAALYLRHPTANSLSRSFNAAKAKGHFEVVRKFTETFTAEQLFPGVRWENLPAEQKPLLAKCKTALVYIGIGEQYLTSNAQDFAETAFDMACAEMDDCCKIEPANHQVRNLREKCQFIRAKNLSSGRLGVCQPA